jgi:hypothetical protein
MDLTSPSGWVVVASIYDASTAHGVAALLDAELVPSEVVAGSKTIGGAPVWEVRVPSVMSERARLLLAPSVLSEAELNYLATGTLTGNDPPN